MEKHKISRSVMHKFIHKQSSRIVKESKSASKPTVFEQLDKLKRFLRASGIKISVNELLKGNFALNFINIYLIP